MYTHYFKHRRDFTDEEWLRLMKFAYGMMANLPSHSETAGGYYSEHPIVLRDWDGKGSPVVDERMISFNGDESAELDHESFNLYRCNRDTGCLDWFCKTSRKPYDFAVCAILWACEKTAPGALEIKSDGDIRGDDWKQARDFVESMLW